MGEALAAGSRPGSMKIGSPRRGLVVRGGPTLIYDIKISTPTWPIQEWVQFSHTVSLSSVCENLVKNWRHLGGAVNDHPFRDPTYYLLS